MPRDRGGGVSESLVTGKRAVLEAIRAGGATEVVVAREARRSQGLRDVLAAAERARVPVVEVPRSALDELADPAEHRGVVARAHARDVRPGLGERDLTGFPFGPDAVVVILDGVEDPQNLGAAARSAEAAGAAMLVTRTHRAAPVSPAAVRASAGVLVHLPHARVANIARAVGRLQDVGFTVVGLDGDAPATVYEAPCPVGRVALVVGSEGTGMSRLVRERCDGLVALPIRGKVGSLNAAASLAAVLYAWVVPTRGAPAGA
jgi:23S rRNA (guanosine2251-2'-O)-methyltransferase